MEDDSDSRAPEPEKPAKKKLTLAEEMQLRKDIARKNWFGTLELGQITPNSILHPLIQDSNNPAESQLNHLCKVDLQEIDITLRALLKLTKQLLSE
jgi:hypothetical protein